MTTESDRAAMVALLRTGRRPWVEYAALVEEGGSAKAVLDEELGSASGQTTLLPEPAGSADELIENARSDLERWAAQGMRLVTVLDSDYPTNLRAVHDRPPMVFIAGTLTRGDATSVAVVGTRKATPSGIERATRIAEHLVDRNYTVVSGLAAGIDTAAHMAALSRHGRTIAVIGTGLARAYPPQNRSLQRRIANQCAVVSQFWPDAPPSRRSFPMRNAVMSGIALATVVVEASQTSGTRIQTRLALAQGRPVFLLASLVERQAWAQECAGRPGTHVVREPVEITNVIDRLMTSDSPARGLNEQDMPSVRELSALYENVMLAPRRGPDVCGTCFNFTAGYTRCYACAHSRPVLDAVVPISYSVAREQLHHALASYKRLDGQVAHRLGAILAAILWRFIFEHEPCLAKAARTDHFDLVTTVPSSDRTRDERHPLRWIVGDLVGPTRDRHRRLLSRAQTEVPPRAFAATKFEATGHELHGESILLIDDTWTTGASAQSAAAALKAGGAGPIAAVVIGRHLNREWHQNDRRLRGIAQPFQWADCALCAEPVAPPRRQS